MPALWPYGPTVFEISNSEIHILELKVPSRGIITSINIEEYEYAHDGTLELFNSVGGVAPWMDPGDIRLITPRAKPPETIGQGLYGPMAIDNGKFEILNVRMPYINRDGTNANPVRRLWGKMQMVGINTAARFAISMNIETPSSR